MTTAAARERHLYPNPQFARASWHDLCGQWGFAHDDADAGGDAGWARNSPFDRQITVPFPRESAVSGVHAPEFHPVVWYRRTFQAPGVSGGKRLMLHFGAVDYLAEVCVSGQLVARHEGGHTPLSADITAALNADGEQIAVVRAEDQPRGGRERADQPVMLTEFGGLSFMPKQGEAWHGYSTVEDAAEFEARLGSLFSAIAASPYVAGYCDTQLTDTEQETNGLLTAAREPKLPIETLRPIITQPAASVPQARIDKDRREARRASGSEA